MSTKYLSRIFINYVLIFESAEPPRTDRHASNFYFIVRLKTLVTGITDNCRLSPCQAIHGAAGGSTTLCPSQVPLEPPLKIPTLKNSSIINDFYFNVCRSLRHRNGPFLFSLRILRANFEGPFINYSFVIKKSLKKKFITKLCAYINI